MSESDLHRPGTLSHAIDQFFIQNFKRLDDRNNEKLLDDVRVFVEINFPELLSRSGRINAMIRAHIAHLRDPHWPHRGELKNEARKIKPLSKQ